MTLKQIRREGVSLRTINIWLIVAAVIISGLMIFSTFHLSASFQNLANTAEEQIELRKAARELTDASDYLTEKVQRFCVQGDLRFAEEYFYEAFQTKHREEAISRMSDSHANNEALEELKKAMNASVELMDMECYAMKLVVEAQGYTDYPEQLKQVNLTDEDKALSPDAKMIRAAKMVHSDEYYAQKSEIKGDMQASLDELEQMAYETDASAIGSLGNELTFVRLVILLQTIGIIFIVWLTSRIGINPVLNAVDRIKEDSTIPEVGANEFRYLARAYNKMYGVYKASLEHLNFKASHDELTGAYNRSGYELLLSSIDLDTTYMLLFDVDDFKGINDGNGHETGDKVLVKLVKTLEANFRSDDYICRIGGDEFVVFMVHIAELQNDLLAQKIRDINEALADTSDGLPPISVSVGIAHGTEVTDAESLFEKTDEAMYESKGRGKNTFTFYSK